MTDVRTLSPGSYIIGETMGYVDRIRALVAFARVAGYRISAEDAAVVVNPVDVYSDTEMTVDASYTLQALDNEITFYLNAYHQPNPRWHWGWIDATFGLWPEYTGPCMRCGLPVYSADAADAWRTAGDVYRCTFSKDDSHAVIHDKAVPVA